MKLIELGISLEKQTVFCRCLLNVQGIEHPITFTLLESDLYAAATADDRDSWDNVDVVSVAQDKLGLEIIA